VEKNTSGKISASTCNSTSTALTIYDSTANQKAVLLEITTVDLSSNQKLCQPLLKNSCEQINTNNPFFKLRSVVWSKFSNYSIWWQ